MGGKASSALPRSAHPGDDRLTRHVVTEVPSVDDHVEVARQQRLRLGSGPADRVPDERNGVAEHPTADQRQHRQAPLQYRGGEQRSQIRRAQSCRHAPSNSAPARPGPPYQPPATVDVKTCAIRLFSESATDPSKS